MGTNENHMGLQSRHALGSTKRLRQLMNDCKDCLAFLCAMFQGSTMTSRQHFGFLPNHHGYLLRANDVCQECLPHALISLTSHVYSLHGDTGILIDHHLATKREQWGSQEHHVR